MTIIKGLRITMNQSGRAAPPPGQECNLEHLNRVKRRVKNSLSHDDEKKRERTFWDANETEKPSENHFLSTQKIHARVTCTKIH